VPAFRNHRGETTKNSGKNWDWDITKVAAGEDFIIMPPYASPPMASSLRKEVVFFPTVRADRLIDWSHTAKLPSEFKPRGSPRPR
jgi:hypothetical protein